MLLDEAQAQQLTDQSHIRFFPYVSGSIPVSGAGARFEKYSQHLPGQFMPLGAYSYTQSFFGPVSRIGRYCSIGADVEVMGNAHPTDWVSTSPAFYRRRRSHLYGSKREFFPHFEDVSAPVEIGNDVWIGNQVLLAHGVKIGTGAIIAARSIVTRDVPPYAIVAGAPARVVRMRFEGAIVERLLSSNWWQWPIGVWDNADPRDIHQFLELAENVSESAPQMPEERFTVAEFLKSAG